MAGQIPCHCTFLPFLAALCDTLDNNYVYLKLKGKDYEVYYIWKIAHPSVKVPHCARNLSYSFDLLLLFNRYLYPSSTIICAIYKKKIAGSVRSFFLPSPVSVINCAKLKINWAVKKKTGLYGQNDPPNMGQINSVMLTASYL